MNICFLSPGACTAALEPMAVGPDRVQSHLEAAPHHDMALMWLCPHCGLVNSKERKGKKSQEQIVSGLARLCLAGPSGNQ